MEITNRCLDEGEKNLLVELFSIEIAKHEAKKGLLEKLQEAGQYYQEISDLNDHIDYLKALRGVYVIQNIFFTIKGYHFKEPWAVWMQ